jgi:hypothetical protein
MNTLLWIVVGFVAYNVIGCITLGLIDSDDKLMDWYKQAPAIGRSVFWFCWPIVVFCYFGSRK